MKNKAIFFFKLNSFRASNFYVFVNKTSEFIFATFLFYNLKFILTNMFETDQIAISCYHPSEWHRHPRVALKTPAIPV